VTLRIVAICAANALMLAVGAGLLPYLRLATTWRDVVRRLPLAYAVGMAATGIAAAELALVGIPVGWIVLTCLAAVSLFAGRHRLEAGGPALRARPRLRTLPALAVLIVICVFLGNAARLFTVAPLVDLDGWAIWATRARALYDFGHPVAPVFTSSAYSGLQYPLFLPELEAIDFRFMTAFDGTLLHLQLLGLAIAFVGGAWTLLRPHAPSLVLAVALLAIVTAPAFFGQLQTASADVPLAMLISLGVAALAAWVRTPAAGLLPAATLFLAAGALTKNEGEVFALSAFVAAFAVVGSGRRGQVVRAALVSAALAVPWHIWLAAHHVTGTSFDLSRLLDPGYLVGHWHRVGTAVNELMSHIWTESAWSRLPVVICAGLVSAVVLRRFQAAAFASAWLSLSFAGLLLVYWTSPFPLGSDLYNSADRTIDTLLIGGVLLVPVLVPFAARPAVAVPA
jgi:hypothetical protein